MLTAQAIKSVADAKRYFFEEDNYYLKDDPDARANTEWWGKGAHLLGLSGFIDENPFESILQGKLPTGQQLGKQNNGEIQHRPGFDLTFSAPKSASILIEIGKDERLLAAHHASVKDVMEYVEQHFSQARVTQNHETRYEKTDNLVVALVKHDISRLLDPQTHTHSIVMNATQCADGEWRSLASCMKGSKDLEINGFFERVMKYQTTLGAIYRTGLAYRASQLGYTVRQTHNDGRFELSSVPDEVIHNFSKRGNSIKDYLDEKGLSGSRAAAFATLETRPTKKSISREALYADWQAQAKELNFDAVSLVEQAKQRTEQTPEKSNITPVLSDVAEKAVRYAMAHWSERDTSLTHVKLVSTALTHAIGKVTLPEMLHAVSHAIQSKELIPLKDERYTTQTLLRYEQEMLKSLEDGRYTVMPITREPESKGIFITQEQKIAVQKVLNSCDRFTGLVGFSGTGKTALIPSIAETIKKEGFKTLILTPSKAEANKLIKKGLQAHTLSGFLAQINRIKNPHLNKHVLILDNAQMVCSKQMNELMALTTQTQSRLISMADLRGYLPREGGNPVAQLREAGLHTAELTQLHRQHHRQSREAIMHTLNGDLNAAFDKIGERIQVVKDFDDRLQQMARQYTRLLPAQRTETLLLVPSQTEKNTIHQYVRADLKNQQQLEKIGITITTFIPKQLTATQTTSARYYAEGNTVRMNNQYYTVHSRNTQDNHITLKSQEGKLIQLNTGEMSNRAKRIEVFESKNIEICVGEQLRGLRQTSKNGLSNGEKVTVTKIQEETLYLQRENGKTVKLNTQHSENRHIDYGYAITPYASCHEEPTTVIAHQSSRTSLTHLRSFYKQLSQARDAAWLYTDERERYIDTLEKNTGDRATVLQVIADKIPVETAMKNVMPVKNPEPPELLAKTALQYAISHLSEREATFGLDELTKTAITTNAFGNVTGKHLNTAITEVVSQGQLIPGPQKERWTTPEAIAIEKEILFLARSTQGVRTPIASEENLQTVFTRHQLNKEQQQAVRMIANTQDGVAVIQGFSGVGKTTMLICAQDVCASQGYTLQGLAPTHQAVRELRERGIPAQTLQSFLGDIQQQKKSPDYSRTVFVLDESSMVSNQLFREVLSHMKESQALFIPLGDKLQLASPDAGKPFALLQDAGIALQKMTDIQRQKDSPVLLEAVKHTIKKDFTKAFSKLNEQTSHTGQPVGIIELKELEEKEGTASQNHYLDALVQNFIARKPEEREQTIILTPANKDRVIVNHLIREELKQEGTLKGMESIASILVPRHLTQTACSRTDAYQVGDVVRFNCGLSSLGIQKGSYLSVHSIDKNLNTVLLKNEKDETIAWQPHRLGGARKGGVEIYTSEERGLCVGDKIRWTRTQKAQGQFAADTAEVIRIQGDNATLKCHDGTLQTQALKKTPNQHFDYAYASTTFSAQGKTVLHVIVYEDSRHINLANQAGFYVEISRAKKNVTIYTNDIEALRKHLEKHTGEKTSALELIGYPLTPKDEKENTAAPSQTKPQPVRWDVNDIMKHIDNQAESFIEKLLGKPQKVTSGEYRYGAHKGSLVISLSGSKRGLWHDFQTGEGGNLLSLLGKSLNHHPKQDFHKTLQAAASYLGLSEFQGHKTIASPAPVKQNPAALDKAQQQKIAYAQRLAKESLPITGTLAEQYLREQRGIKGELPDSFRFHPQLYSKANKTAAPALLVLAENSAGKVQAVQAIYLDSKTANKAKVDVQKQVFGVMRGALVSIQKGDAKDNATFIAEGPETGLSIREAFPQKDIKITLGAYNYRHINPAMVGQKVVLCLDNDGPNASTQTSIKHSIERLQQSGKEVWTNQPDKIKTDYNDVLKDGGIEAVRNNIDNSAKIELPTVPQQEQNKHTAELPMQLEQTKVATIPIKDIPQKTAIHKSVHDHELTR